MDVSTHMKLLRRAADFVQQGEGKPKPDIEIPSWLAVILAIEILAYAISMFKIRYTVGSVIGTLAIVEEPESKMLVEVGYTDDDEDGLDKKATDVLIEPEVALIKVKPVTAKIRTAMRHLKAQGGRRARFRGLSLFFVYACLKGIFTGLMTSFMPMHAGHAISVVIAEVLLSKLEMVWVHHVIAEPTSKTWMQRTRSLTASWKQIAPAALVRAVALQLTFGLPAALLCTYTPLHKIAHGKSHDLTPEELQQGAKVMIGAMIAGLTLLVLVYVPAHVTFVRVAASMLPEEDNTIVTFDRTFGGKVDPAGKIGLLSAWATFTWAQRRRYLGLMVKIGVIMAAVSVLFSVLITTELSLFTSLDLKNLAARRSL